MIEVKHLTKRYGGHTAVSDLSFTIEKGVVYGFLGPNGAGKSTTMNIITGCLGATDGSVSIDGHDISENPMKAKRLIGYLPEQPPLYMDMTPEEYLSFVASAKGIPRSQRDEQLRNVMRRTGIELMQKRLIRNLSKGYKQRVGIAQALLGDPEVIILDEPTVGLDPAQIIEIRELILELGRKHTIVLSSHILSEVQAVCQSIMIISKGKLVASDTAENLTSLFKGQENIRLEARADKAMISEVLEGVTGIEDVRFSSGEADCLAAEIVPVDGRDLREAIFRAFAAADVPLLELHCERASLEDVFLELTQEDANAEGQQESEIEQKDVSGQ
ncbi:MAG: ABC transporter ATP-binding protein [Clostridia bacterium]|nr:ABC transporter ATP-binding protein [Clostridia bacterium]MBQ8962844.1 ABC transporter ATP-binding protein [Clostridia bacterium]